MSASYRLEPIPTLPTRAILRGKAEVGMLFAPSSRREAWEIFPDPRNTAGLPDGDRGFLTRRFDTEDDALAFLDIGLDLQVAA